jgi:hypothetical protein
MVSFDPASLRSDGMSLRSSRELRVASSALAKEGCRVSTIGKIVLQYTSKLNLGDIAENSQLVARNSQLFAMLNSYK